MLLLQLCASFRDGLDWITHHQTPTNTGSFIFSQNMMSVNKIQFRNDAMWWWNMLEKMIAPFILIIASLLQLTNQNAGLEFSTNQDLRFPSLLKIRAGGGVHAVPCAKKTECPQISTTLFTRQDYLMSKSGKRRPFKPNIYSNTSKNAYNPSSRVRTIYKFPIRKG